EVSRVLFRNNGRKDIEHLKQSSNPFATAVIAGIYASRSKRNIEVRYEFKRSLVTSILEKYEIADEAAINHLNKLIYFVDNLLKLPEEMKNNLREELNPYLGEEVITKMRAEKSNPPTTHAELIVESRQEGKKEGKEEAIKDIVIALIRKNYSDQEIMKITELTTAELEAIRESLQ